MRATFYVLIGGFLTGVLFRSFFPASFAGLCFIVLLVVCLVAVGTHTTKRSMYVYVAVFLCTSILGSLWTHRAFLRYETGRVFPDMSVYEGYGTVIKEPDMRDEYSVVYVSLKHVPSKTDVVVRTKVPLSTSIAYGESVFIKGTIEVPKSFTTETGRVFDYPGFLMKDGVHYTMTDTMLTRTDGFTGNAFVSFLLTFKHAWMQTVSIHIREPGASLVNGVVVGAKQSLGERLLQAFRDTGIIHIVVLSGYNLTLVANAVIRCTRLLPRYGQFFLGSLSIVCFAILVGGGATVVRASIMAVLGMLAPLTRRPYVLIRALFLAGLGMVIWNPFVLVYDAGFQLSFMATFGLILFTPYFEKVFRKIPEYAGMRGIISATLATQLSVLPLLFYHIGTVSLVAPIVNVLVLPIVPLTMGLGTLVGLLGMVHAALAVPFAVLSEVVLSYIFIVVDTFSAVPFATIHVQTLPWYTLVCMYIPIWLVYVYIKKHSPFPASVTVTHGLRQTVH